MTPRELTLVVPKVPTRTSESMYPLASGVAKGSKSAVPAPACTFAVKRIDSDSLLTITLGENPSATDVTHLLNDLRRERKHFTNGYRVLIELPATIREPQAAEIPTIDLAVFAGKIEGLKQAVIEVQAESKATLKVARMLQSIYQGLQVHVSVSPNKVESRKLLGLLWK